MTPTQVAKSYIRLHRKKKSGTSFKALDKVMETLTFTQQAYVHNVVRCKVKW